MDKQIYFSAFNSMNGKWVPVHKLVTPSMEFEKITSQMIGNLAVFYTQIHFFFLREKLGSFCLLY